MCIYRLLIKTADSGRIVSESENFTTTTKFLQVINIAAVNIYNKCKRGEEYEIYIYVNDEIKEYVYSDITRRNFNTILCDILTNTYKFLVDEYLFNE